MREGQVPDVADWSKGFVRSGGAVPALPLLLSSPHSGSRYETDLLGPVALGRPALRLLEDGPIDSLLGPAVEAGAIALGAVYPRVICDLNRGPRELDTAWMETWEGEIDATPRVRAGLGVIPTRLGRQPIWRRRLTRAEVARRLDIAYAPYHAALQSELAAMKGLFGRALLLDCHSMPGVLADLGGRPVEIALGDRYGRSCDPLVMQTACRTMRQHGFSVGINRPFAGGYITQHFGRPECGIDALQIEISRPLFMVEATHCLHEGAGRIRTALAALVRALAAVVTGIVESAAGEAIAAKETLTPSVA